MKKKTSIALVCVVTLLWSCKNDRRFPEVIKLSEYKKTEFQPTLEHKISNQKNSVYCVTLLYAWEEIREQIGKPLQISKELTDLTLLDGSKSFIDVLESGEYSVSGEVDGDLIRAQAEFSKSLPFGLKLESFNDRLVFDNVKVASFGVSTYNYERLENIEIIYYKNDENLIIKLLPIDKYHEIVLYKSDKTFASIAKMHEEILRLSEIGSAERKIEKQKWKYHFADEDEIVIPKFNFNIETNYATLEGNEFKTTNQNFRIERAWQRTAFILDESGAEIESEADYVSVEEIEEEYEKPRPKNMIFNKPFLVLLKRTDAKNPYFALWATNAELMIKE